MTSRPGRLALKASRFALPLCVLALAAACGKGPAEQALAAASSAFDQARPELEQYVPDDLKSISDELSKAKGAFDRGDYKRALSFGQSVLLKVQGALEGARRKKDELVAAFTQLKASLPARVDSLRRRLGELARATSLPADLDQATVETAQANLETVGKAWSEALSKFDSGDVVNAVTQANDVRVQVEEMAKAFLPAGARK